jgi:hypothetical protein
MKAKKWREDKENIQVFLLYSLFTRWQVERKGKKGKN